MKIIKRIKNYISNILNTLFTVPVYNVAPLGAKLEHIRPL